VGVENRQVGLDIPVVASLYLVSGATAVERTRRLPRSDVERPAGLAVVAAPHPVVLLEPGCEVQNLADARLLTIGGWGHTALDVLLAEPAGLLGHSR
jgi:hypothetical protein